MEYCCSYKSAGWDSQRGRCSRLTKILHVIFACFGCLPEYVGQSQCSDCILDSMGPPPQNFFPEVESEILDRASGSQTEDAQSTQHIGGSFQDVSESTGDAQHVPAVSTASAQDDAQETDIGIAVADDLSVGNCFVLHEFMRVSVRFWFLCGWWKTDNFFLLLSGQISLLVVTSQLLGCFVCEKAYQHLPEYQLHCLKVMRSLVETPLPGVSGTSHTSLPSALADQDTNSGNASSSGEESGLVRALAHPESWVCSTCTYRNRGPRKASESAAIAANGQGPPPMPVAWLRGEIEKPAGEKDWGPGKPKYVVWDGVAVKASFLSRLWTVTKFWCKKAALMICFKNSACCHFNFIVFRSLFYTREQQLRLSVDESGNHVDDPTHDEHADASGGSLLTCEWFVWLFGKQSVRHFVLSQPSYFFSVMQTLCVGLANYVVLNFICLKLKLSQYLWKTLK